MNNKSYLDNFFHFVSRYIVFVPILIVAVALILTYNQSAKIQSNQQLITPAPIPTSMPTSSPSGVLKLDLNGPYSCQGFFDGVNYAVAIKNKQVIAHIIQSNKKNNFLVSGDCLYEWEDGAYTGQKICSIGQYLSLFESLNRLGIANFGTLFEYLPKLGMQSKLPVNPNQIQSLLSSCKKQDVSDRLFIIPPMVLFKNGAFK